MNQREKATMVVDQQALANLLAEHQPVRANDVEYDDADEAYDAVIVCNHIECKFSIGPVDWYDWHEKFAEHQAEVIVRFLHNSA